MRFKYCGPNEKTPNVLLAVVIHWIAMTTEIPREKSVKYSIFYRQI